MTSSQSEELFNENIRYAYFQAHRWNRKLRGLIEWDDLKQLCLIGLYQAAMTYRPERGYFISLAQMCIANAVRMELRTVNKRILDNVNSDLMDTYLRNKSDGSDVAASLLWRETLREIELEIDRLPVKSRMYIQLYYLDGFRQEAIGDLFAVDRGGISILIVRALKKIRKQLEERGHEYAHSFGVTTLRERTGQARPRQA